MKKILFGLSLFLSSFTVSAKITLPSLIGEG